MNKQALFEQIKKKKSFLCVGLDPDIAQMPPYLTQELSSPEAILIFNKQIIDATHPFAIAYKPNLAFYECYGSYGFAAFEQTVAYIRKKDPNLFIIADAKRGDIGNTSKMYAKAFLENAGCDAITVAPYMGKDSIEPFLAFKDKWAIVLALTSNEGAQDFQWHEDSNYLYQDVIIKSQKWNNSSKFNMMYVIGATKANYLKDVRKLAPDHFILVPGVGAQGGDLGEVARHGLNSECGLLVNVSRDILYAGKGEAFAEASEYKAQRYQQQMEQLLKSHNLVE
jgi:orotidine-5'-phosphate decarboxylase